MLRNLKVRQALNHAIDREAMVKNLVGEGSRVINTICFPSQFGCTDEGAPRYPYDPQKAKQMLAEAGYPNGFDLPLYAYRERHQTEAMIGYLQAVGVKGNLNFLQYAAMRDQVRANKAGMAHQTWGSFSVNESRPRRRSISASSTTTLPAIRRSGISLPRATTRSTRAYARRPTKRPSPSSRSGPTPSRFIRCRSITPLPPTSSSRPIRTRRRGSGR